MPDAHTARRLSAAQIDQFVRDGFVKIDNAFSREVADAARAILWRDTGCDPDDPTTWTRPVIRLGMYTQEPFVKAANTPVLNTAFDQLVGQGRWQPCMAMGTFPIRFPSSDDPGDAGWHVDMSFGSDNPDFMSWRANVSSKGRALLMLFLFSDIGEADAPTRIRVGSHADIARTLAPAGDAGLTLRELMATGFGGTEEKPIALEPDPKVCCARSGCVIHRFRLKRSGDSGCGRTSIGLCIGVKAGGFPVI